MELKKYKLADIANIEISGVDKKTIEGETPVRLCNFVDVYYNWAVTKEKAKAFMKASAKQTEIDITTSFYSSDFSNSFLFKIWTTKNIT